jgi:hypothetical protein
MIRAFFLSRLQGIYDRSFNGFGGSSGLSPNWSQYTRTATQHRAVFLVNNKKEEASVTDSRVRQYASIR